MCIHAFSIVSLRSAVGAEQVGLVCIAESLGNHERIGGA